MTFFNKMFFAFMIIAFSGSSNAALITTSGTDVSFTYDDSLLGLFGAPKVSGDTLFFMPTNFEALRENIIGGQLTSSTFKVTIDGLQGHHISSVSLTENGDYLREGEKAIVSAKGELRAVDLTDPLTKYVSKITPTEPFAQTLLNGPTGAWEANAYLSLSNKNSFDVSIQNILNAKILAGNTGDELAYIEKEFVGLTVNGLPPITANAIPLPQAVWLFGSGFLALMSFSNRKKML